MSASEVPEDRIESLVRQHLLRQAATVDRSAMLARVRNASPPAGETPHLPRKRHGHRWALGAVAAAAVLVAFLGGLRLGTPPVASAETLVRQARSQLDPTLHRCYLVQVTPEAGSPLRRFPRLAETREFRLWTRGDRFWLQSPDAEPRWVVGRNGDGRVWVVLGREHAFWLEAGEASDSLGLLCDVLTMNVEKLLGELLLDYELTRERTPEGELTSTIQARPRTDLAAARLSEARLELDPASKVVQKLTLHRVHQGRPLARVTFTLIETRPESEASLRLFSPEGHLPADKPVYTRQLGPRIRELLLRQHFGINVNRSGE